MASSERAPRRRLRADAARNRERLLDAGAALLASEGDGFAFNAVARTAGVGAGTLHRHFPNKAALLLALYISDLSLLSARADELMQSHPRMGALEEWLHEVADFSIARPGIADALRAAVRANDPENETAYRGVAGALEKLLKLNDGEVRADADPNDVLLAVCSVWDIPGPQERTERAGRVVSLVLHGLRIHPTP